MTLQEYKDKVADINARAKIEKEKAYDEYVNSLTDLRVGDNVKLIPLINDKQLFANWIMQVKFIEPYVLLNKRTKLDELRYITLTCVKPDGTNDYYNWVGHHNEYKLEKIGD